MKRFYEAGKLNKIWIEQYCKGDWNTCIRYHLEERGEPHPDWMLPDGTIDEDLRQFYLEMVGWKSLLSPIQVLTQPDLFPRIEGLSNPRNVFLTVSNLYLFVISGFRKNRKAILGEKHIQYVVTSWTFGFVCESASELRVWKAYDNILVTLIISDRGKNWCYVMYSNRNLLTAVGGIVSRNFQFHDEGLVWSIWTFW